jgi:hypothetical protein
MQNRIVLVIALLLSCIICSQWSIASEGCRIDKGITIPIATASVTFKDGTVRSLKGIELRYMYVYDSDTKFYNPPTRSTSKRELFIGLCAPNTAVELERAGGKVSKVTLELKAQSSYPHKVRLLLRNGKEFVVEGLPYYLSPLVPHHDFLVDKSKEGAVSVFRLFMSATDTNSDKAVSAVVFDATEVHAPDIQIMSIQIKPDR